MRITERRMTEIVNASLEKTRAEAAKKAQELSSGVKLTRASQDGVGWAEAARARARRLTADAHESTIARSRERLQAQEGALAGIGNVLERATEIAIQGANAATGDSRTLLADEIRRLMSAGIQAANTKGNDGEYLMATSSGTTAPFDTGTGAYSGSSTVREVDVGPELTVGAKVPGSVLQLSAGPPVVNIFTVLDRIADALEANDPDDVAAELDNLEQGRENVANARGDIAAYLAALQQADEARSDTVINTTQIFDDNVATDVVEAATGLARAEAAVEAARVAGQQMLQLVAGFLR